MTHSSSGGFGGSLRIERGIAAVNYSKQNTAELNPLARARRVLTPNFGRGSKKIRKKINSGLHMQVGNGGNTLFWEDSWLSTVPLKIEFPNHFNYCHNKESTVRECWGDGTWHIPFRRALGERDLAEWENLMEKLGSESSAREGQAHMGPRKLREILNKIYVPVPHL
jgi:hypothetical protein